MKKALTVTELLTLDAHSLQKRLEAKSLTSVELVESCLAQIESHDRQGVKLRAITAIAPLDSLRERARQLDKERSSGHVRSRLHGIPLLVKDAIATSPRYGLKTSVGSLALKDSIPLKTSKIIDKELCDIKGESPSNGWSAFGGQTRSAYILFDPEDKPMGHSNPCGSSTGSAVGVSAGYSPLALGTDSIGSLHSPATRAALYTLKPTPGSVDMSGIWPVSIHFDAVGGMAKSVIDLASITDCLLEPDARESFQSRELVDCLSKSFRGLRIGFLDPRVWHYPPELIERIEEVDRQIINAVEDAVSNIRNREAAPVEYPVSVPPVSSLKRDGRMTTTTAILYELKRSVSHYLNLADVGGVHSLEDLVEFNKKHASEELPKDHPDQDWLLKGLHSRPSQEEYETDVAYFRHVTRDEGIEKLFKEKNLNLLAFSADCLFFEIACAAGVPIASMPLGILDYNGRPFGLGLVAQGGREDLMFQFMIAFEANFPERGLPSFPTTESKKL